MAPPSRPRSASLSTPDKSKRLKDDEAFRDAKRISDRIDATIEAERNVYKKFKRVYKILLLGQSESGKSTTLKNFQLIYTPQVFNQERESWRGVILLNVVRSIRLILAVVDEARAVEERDKLERAAEAAGPDDASETPTESTTLSFITDEHRRLMLRLASLEQVEAILRARLSSSTRMSPIDETSDYPEAFVHSRSGWHGPLRQLDPAENDGEPGVPIRRGGVDINDPDDPVHIIHLCREDMIELWNDQSIRQLLRLKRLRLREMPGFFLDDLERVTDLNYVPSDDDVIRARLKSVGVSEYQFVMDSSIGDPPTLWRIFDVGGSRTQRQAWTPFFDDCNAIIFLAPISAFDEVLAEDHSVNRLEDSILLWKSVCSNKLLARCEMMLFLNKCDILKVKLKAGVKIQKYIRSYRDRENTIEVAAKYFREKFHAIQREYSPEKRSFFCHMTAVTDTRATAVILARVREAIMRSNLESLALA